MFKRVIQGSINGDFFKGKAIVIVGARQVGKTTLVNQILSDCVKSIKRFNADDPADRELLENKNLEVLKQIIGGSEIIFIDEAQKVSDAGNMLKLLIDYYKKSKQFIVTGSSSLNLLDATSESLTGRKFTYTLFPLSLEETYVDKNLLDIRKNLESHLIYGMYPEVVMQTSFEDKARILHEVSSSYLYKDIFDYQEVRNPSVLNALLKALALQIGSEVSYSEVSKLIGVDVKTVGRYIDLLEKSYVLFRMSAYTTGKRREISKNKKVYFYDVGIRNSVIDNFSEIDSRNDVGVLWENFLIVERMKFKSYHTIYNKQFFWRTYDGSEIDLVEEGSGKLSGYEIKWGDKKPTVPEKWREYKNSSYQVINRDSLLDFVL
ncbi:MAG: ATP-binding protein [Patescibacteria group bacterium]